MAKLKRIYKKMTEAEKAEYDELIEQLDAERPEIEAWAHQVMRRSDAIDGILKTLAGVRRRRGLTLAEVDEASGLGRSNISRLENGHNPNPTLETLLAYAQGLGVEVRLLVVDPESKQVIDNRDAA